MSKPVYELAQIMLKASVSEEELIKSSDRFQTDFLSEQPGFLGRDLVKNDKGEYFDLVRWASLSDAEAIMSKVMHSEACSAYFSVMDMEGSDPAEGVVHFQTIRSYRAE